MDDVARLRAGDRADLFTAAAASTGMTPTILEKDFWVCWTLGRLFEIENAPAGLLFKGGTSLSKVYGLIDRFSEDIDLSLNRKDLGFDGEKDPANSSTRKQARKKIDSLADACRRIVAEDLLPLLDAAFRAALSDHAAWRLELDPDDAHGQTILFWYPAGPETSVAGYIRPNVRLEIGARSDHWPAANAVVRPYAADALPRLFKQPEARVRVLLAERTFWEKVTALHEWYHTPADKPIRDRQSRHFYDVVRIADSEYGERAIADTTLLEAVANHKKVFFASAHARYDEARPGTLRIVPPDFRIAELRRDYEQMAEMIFGKAPEFDALIEQLAEVERRINGG